MAVVEHVIDCAVNCDICCKMWRGEAGSPWQANLSSHKFKEPNLSGPQVKTFSTKTVEKAYLLELGKLLNPMGKMVHDRWLSILS